MTEHTPPIQLAIVDDEQLIVTLLAQFFSEQKATQVLMTATCGDTFLEQLGSGDALPDVVLLDLRLKERDGAEIAMIIKEHYPTIRVIVISSYYKKSFIGYMLKTGICAFLPKEILPQQLLEIIVVVHQRGYYFLPEQIEVMRTQVAPKVPKPKFTVEAMITHREKEILTLICQQHTAQEIADKLFITKRTVEGHKNRLLAKTGVKNTAGLVIYAIQKKLVDIRPIYY